MGWYEDLQKLWKIGNPAGFTKTVAPMLKRGWVEPEPKGQPPAKPMLDVRTGRSAVDYTRKWPGYPNYYERTEPAPFDYGQFAKDVGSNLAEQPLATARAAAELPGKFFRGGGVRGLAGVIKGLIPDVWEPFKVGAIGLYGGKEMTDKYLSARDQMLSEGVEPVGLNPEISVTEAQKQETKKSLWDYISGPFKGKESKTEITPSSGTATAATSSTGTPSAGESIPYRGEPMNNPYGYYLDENGNPQPRNAQQYRKFLGLGSRASVNEYNRWIERMSASNKASIESDKNREALVAAAGAKGTMLKGIPEEAWSNFALRYTGDASEALRKNRKEFNRFKRIQQLVKKNGPDIAAARIKNKAIDMGLSEADLADMMGDEAKMNEFLYQAFGLS
jgi:hypothetical protein